MKTRSRRSCNMRLTDYQKWLAGMTTQQQFVILCAMAKILVDDGSLMWDGDELVWEDGDGLL